MIKVDARGKLCPEPLIMTKRALKGAATGDNVEILTDNPTSCGNLSAYLRELGISPEVSDRGDCTSLSFTVKETSANSAAEERAERCACPSAGYCRSAIAWLYAPTAWATATTSSADCCYVRI